MTSNEEIPQKPDTQKASKDEIDLLELITKLWRGRKTIIRFTIVGLVIGLLIAIFSPKEYTASTIMVPQTESSNSSKLGGLSSLAAMAGFNMNSVQNTSTLSPMIYPKIVNSVPFQLDLLEAKYTLPELTQPISLFSYYSDIKKPGLATSIKKYTIGLPGIIMNLLKDPEKIDKTQDKQLLHLTSQQERIRKIISKQLIADINDKEGYITISARFDNPYLAAQVTLKTQQLLQQYITEFKIEKASEKLQFIEARYAEKKAEFEEAQKNLARFRDRNKNMASAMALTEEERLQSEYELAYSVYSELAKQLEQAKIQVKEETPVFAVIQPVQIPTERSKPNRPLILFLWIFLGGIAGVSIILGRKTIKKLKDQKAEIQ